MRIRNIAILIGFVILSFIIGFKAGNNLGRQQGAKAQFQLFGHIRSEAEASGDSDTIEWMGAGAPILKKYDVEVEGRYIMLQFQRAAAAQKEDVQQQRRR
jgi:hypothetical protein